MKILITTPSLTRHGGIRIIGEWSNRLAELHDVFLYCEKPGQWPCDWFIFSDKVKFITDLDVMKSCDCLIITSPHSIYHEDSPHCPKKVFIFLQMIEHLFHTGLEWLEKCKRFYTSKHPMILISKWNERVLVEDYKRTGDTYYVGNGVNLDDFPISHAPKSGKIVLVEGWEGYNSAKDIDMIAPKVALRLKKEGYTIIAYGQVKLKTMSHALNRYYYKPSLTKINQLYEIATILLKASRYDARACASVEAMTKMTPTARAIIEGDDDLIHEYNCLRCCYNENELYTISNRLLEDSVLRTRLAENGLSHVLKYNWDYWINIINNILCN